VPSPKKLNVASMRMAFPSQIEAMMRIGAVTLGRIWLAIMHRWRQPRACAASRGSVSPRALLHEQCVSCPG
jgi:hypothetical protein